MQITHDVKSDVLYREVKYSYQEPEELQGKLTGKYAQYGLHASAIDMIPNKLALGIENSTAKLLFTCLNELLPADSYYFETYLAPDFEPVF